MIVKNEEALLARCLSSVAGADQIVIVDTGSQDRTIEIAREFTDEVYLDCIWNDDFSFCQNHAKAKMKTDFILSIDADEILLCGFDKVREAVELAKDTVRVTMRAEGDTENVFGFPRLFRNSPDIFWVSAIHKHLNIPGDGEEVGEVKISYGFSPAHLQDPDRSLRMLEKTVAEEQRPVRNLYYLGREYWYKKRFVDAIFTLQRYVKVAHWPAEEADAHLIMAQAYLELKMIEESASEILQALKINPNFKEAVLFMELISHPMNKSQWRRMAMAADNRDLVWSRVPVEPVNDVYLIAPHQDDEILFCSYTLMREKPIIISITDSYIQPNRGDIACEADIRRQETINAATMIGCPVVFLGIKDTDLTEGVLRERLRPFNPYAVYIPALQGGNAQHDLISTVCSSLWGERCEHYCTYTKTELYTTGAIEIKPTQEEIDMKNRMLDCFKSQLALPSTRPHFDAVRGKSEWLQ